MGFLSFLKKPIFKSKKKKQLSQKGGIPIPSVPAALQPKNVISTFKPKNVISTATQLHPVNVIKSIIGFFKSKKAKNNSGNVISKALQGAGCINCSTNVPHYEYGMKAGPTELQLAQQAARDAQLKHSSNSSTTDKLFVLATLGIFGVIVAGIAVASTVQAVNTPWQTHLVNRVFGTYTPNKRPLWMRD